MVSYIYMQQIFACNNNEYIYSYNYMQECIKRTQECISNIDWINTRYGK